jgi:hypothetical protein
MVILTKGLAAPAVVDQQGVVKTQARGNSREQTLEQTLTLGMMAAMG